VHQQDASRPNHLRADEIQPLRLVLTARVQDWPHHANRSEDILVKEPKEQARVVNCTQRSGSVGNSLIVRALESGSASMEGPSVSGTQTATGSFT
jgi:hypothetical protein